jgi:enoyl-CoA hydratase
VTVRVERRGTVATVILSRPEVANAVDGPTAAALATAFRDFAADEGARVAVLWGEGGNFCSGADLGALGSERGNRVAPDGDGPMGPTRLWMHKPVIAAIAGHAVAGGLELAAWCDLRVAEEDAVFGVYCRRWGVPLIDGGSVRLPKLVGLSRALDLVLTGRPLPAPEAHAWGLVNRLVPRGDARPEAEALAARLAELPQTCLRSDRASVYRSFTLADEAALAAELELALPALESAELTTGVGRFRTGGGRHGEGSR